jgi:hypothetical protein
MDPAQANNVAGDIRYADVLTMLQRRLALEARNPTPQTRRD